MADDKATLGLQALWKKAFEEGELVLDFKSETDQIRAKFMLYTVSRKVKLEKAKGAAYPDFVLADAVEECMISITSKTQLTIRHKSAAPLLKSMMDQAGIDIEALADQTPEALEIAASARRLAERMETDRRASEATPDPAAPANRYASILKQNDPNRN